MQNLQSFVPFLDELASAASTVIHPHFRTQLPVGDKSGGGGGTGDIDPVTAADRDAEAVMRELIGRRYPDHGIIGEEFDDDRPDAEHVWVLDPIDGTRAFICGLPLWGILIGLRHRGQPVLGMIAQPHIGERFVGTGDAAWMERNGDRRPIHVRPCPGIEQAVVSATSPTMFTGDDMTRFRAVESACRLLRYGYDCYAYAMTSMGFIDCIVEASLKPYDIDPIIPIIQGAGGSITDWQGESPTGKSNIIAAGDRRVLDDVLTLIN